MRTICNFSKLFILATLFLVSCDNVTISTGNGENKVTGNGKEDSKTRDINPFSSISIEGVFNVILTQGNKESIKIEADENIIPLIETTVDHDTLKVRLKDNTSLKKMDKLNVYITLVDVSTINTVGVGSLKCTNPLHLKNIALNCQGVGATKLKLDVDNLSVKSEIVGALLLSGVAKETSISHNGVGVIEAFDLKSQKLSLNIGGIGAAEVFASDELSIDASGVGGVKYKGGATKKHINNSGIGKIVCVDCK